MGKSECERDQNNDEKYWKEGITLKNAINLISTSPTSAPFVVRIVFH